MTQRQRRCRRIGLTGGIGAGKSTAAARLAARGALVLDADEIARRALSPDGACYRAVTDAFGAEIHDQDGEIDRKALAAIVFSDGASREKLNGIVHPYVISEMLAKADAVFSRTDGLVFFEVPLLFESGMDRKMDKNILIVSDEETRVARIAARDGCTREAALLRIRAQMTDEEKIKRADYVLQNDGTKEELEGKVDRLYAALTNA